MNEFISELKKMKKEHARKLKGVVTGKHKTDFMDCHRQSTKLVVVMGAVAKQTARSITVLTLSVDGRF
jgi:hypothetical protein